MVQAQPLGKCLGFRRLGLGVGMTEKRPSVQASSAGSGTAK